MRLTPKVKEALPWCGAGLTASAARLGSLEQGADTFAGEGCRCRTTRPTG